MIEGDGVRVRRATRDDLPFLLEVMTDDDVQPFLAGGAAFDAQSAEGARKWNDANALAISLRATSDAELGEILDAWFAAEASSEADDRANVEHLDEIEG